MQVDKYLYNEDKEESSIVRRIETADEAVQAESSLRNTPKKTTFTGRINEEEDEDSPSLTVLSRFKDEEPLKSPHRENLSP